MLTSLTSMNMHKTELNTDSEMTIIRQDIVMRTLQED